MKGSSHITRVIVADDHPLVRAGLRALLEQLPGVQVVSEASDGRQVIDLVRAEAPDLVLMDIAMPGLNGLEAAEHLAREFPHVRVIILSVHQNEEFVWRALRSGAAGYLLKTAPTDEFEAALEKVMNGEVYLSREIATLMNGESFAHHTEHKDPLESLTTRQREILQLIAEGKNTKEIADILQLSPKTIEYHRMKLMEALDIHDIPSLVRFAVRVGLVLQES